MIRILIDYLQFGIMAVIVFAVPVILATIIKVYVEKIIVARKLWDFFWHIGPAILFLFLAANKKIAFTFGEVAFGNSWFGFVVFLLLGLQSLAGTFFFAHEIFTGKHLGDDRKKQKRRTQEEETKD